MPATQSADLKSLLARARVADALEPAIKKSGRTPKEKLKRPHKGTVRKLAKQDKLLDDVFGVTRERQMIGSKAVAVGTPGHAGITQNVMIEDRQLWVSVHQFAIDSNIENKTVAIRVRKSGIRGRLNNVGVLMYRVRDLIPAVILADDEGKLDVDKLDPLKRKAHYQAENDRIKMMVQSGQLVPLSRMEVKMAVLAKLFAQFCDTLPDYMERDCGAGPVFLKKLENLLDRLRNDMYKDVIATTETGVVQDESTDDSGE